MSTAPSEVLMTGKKKKVKKPANESAGAINLVTDELAALAHACEGLSKEEAFAAVSPLMETVDSSYIRLGGVLAVIRDNDWWQSEGMESFKELLEKKFGLRHRKATYLIQIYEDLVNSGVEWDQVKSLGWCKLKEISPVVTKENCAEWVAKAESLTVLQLHDVVAKAKAAKEQSLPTSGAVPEDASSDTVTMTFKLHVEQKETIRQALDKAKKEANTEYDGVALEAISINYLSGGKVTKKVAGADLKTSMQKAGAEAVLNLFGELWPDIEVQVTM